MAPVQLLIIGGGPAGMAAALLAGRARLDTVLVNVGNPRNAASHASHGFLTRDGVQALELQQIALEQLEKYPSVRHVRDSVVDVVPQDGGFSVVGSSGRWLATRVIFATGFRTTFDSSGLPDVDAVYGRSVFPCPFCDGFEVADRPLAVFASSTALHMAKMIRIWSDDLVVFTNGRPIDPEDLRALQADGIPVETASIERLVHDDGALQSVSLDDGRSIPREAGFLGEVHFAAGTDLPARLGVGTAVHPMIAVEHFEADEFGKTSVEGIYVVGDLKRVFGGITAAAHDGYSCVTGIVHELAAD